MTVGIRETARSSPNSTIHTRPALPAKVGQIDGLQILRAVALFLVAWLHSGQSLESWRVIELPHFTAFGVDTSSSSVDLSWAPHCCAPGKHPVYPRCRASSNVASSATSRRPAAVTNTARQTCPAGERNTASTSASVAIPPPRHQPAFAPPTFERSSSSSSCWQSTGRRRPSRRASSRGARHRFARRLCDRRRR